MITGQQGIPSPRTLDAAADLAGRLRLVLDEEDAEVAVEVVVGAGWCPPDGPLGELVTEEEYRAALDVFSLRSWPGGENQGRRLRAALECYGRRLLARHGRGGP